MRDLTRRGFIAASAAAVTVKSVPVITKAPVTKRILTLAYDHSMGMMRAFDRVVLR